MLRTSLFSIVLLLGISSCCGMEAVADLLPAQDHNSPASLDAGDAPYPIFKGADQTDTTVIPQSQGNETLSQMMWLAGQSQNTNSSMPPQYQEGQQAPNEQSATSPYALQQNEPALQAESGQQDTRPPEEIVSNAKAEISNTYIQYIESEAQKAATEAAKTASDSTYQRVYNETLKKALENLSATINEKITQPLIAQISDNLQQDGAGNPPLQQ